MSRIYEIVAIVGMAVLMLCGCRSVRYVAGPATHDTLRITRVAHDTLHIRDSVYVSREVRGDTILVSTDRWHNVVKKVEVRDTVYKAKTDTIRVPVPAVQKKSWYQRTIVPIVDSMLAVIAILVVVRLLVQYIKNRNNG